MTDKSTTIKPEAKVGTNPMTLPWPVDKHGITSMLKKEGARAVGRINGDADKLDVFMATLRVLVAHAKEKYVAQQEQTAKRMASEGVRIEGEKERAEKIRLASIARLQREIAHLEGLGPKGKK